jgi:hypothetical protein
MLIFYVSKADLYEGDAGFYEAHSGLHMGQYVFVLIVWRTSGTERLTSLYEWVDPEIVHAHLPFLLSVLACDRW